MPPVGNLGVTGFIGPDLGRPTGWERVAHPPGQVDKRLVARTQLAVADCDAAEVLEVYEQILDLVPGPLAVMAVFGWVLSMGSWWDGGNYAVRGEHRRDSVAIVGFISD